MDRNDVRERAGRVGDLFHQKAGLFRCRRRWILIQHGDLLLVDVSYGTSDVGLSPDGAQPQHGASAAAAWDESDIDEYRTLVTERGNGVPSVATIQERIATQLAATEQTGIALLPIVRRLEGDFIGYCGLIVGRWTLDQPEIAHELLQRAHGHGYATEAARAVLDAAIATRRTRLWATVGTRNILSLRVLEKLEFARDRVTTKDDGEQVMWLTRALT